MRKFITGLLLGLLIGIITNGVTYFDCKDCPERAIKEVKDLKGIEVYLFGHIFRPITWR